MSEQPQQDFSIGFSDVPRVDGAVNESKRPHWGVRLYPLIPSEMEVAGLRLSVIEGKPSRRTGMCLEEAALELHLWYTYYACREHSLCSTCVLSV